MELFSFEERSAVFYNLFKIAFKEMSLNVTQNALNNRPKPILCFWVQALPIDTAMIVEERMLNLSKYIEYQRKNINDFDYFVFPRKQDSTYEVQILNPIGVSEEAYKRLKNYTLEMLTRAKQEVDKERIV